MIRCLVLLLTMTSGLSATDPAVVPLWSGPAPQSTGSRPEDIPTLTVFLPARADEFNIAATCPAIIICPGGGYGMLDLQYEGVNEAQWFAAHGVAAFVLKYRLPSQGYRHPVPLLDAQRAVRLVRSRAADWHVDPAKVGVMGFSAGGHLASTLETHFDTGDLSATDPADQLSCRPDFAVLVYPVISMRDGLAHSGSKMNLLGPNPPEALVASLSNDEQVTPQTPPTLLVHAADDHMVSPENSHHMLAALKKAGVVCALQEYPTGSHGFGFGRPQDISPKDWLVHVGEWLKTQGFMP